MKNFILNGSILFMVMIFSIAVFAQSIEVNQLSDYKKVKVQFTKSTVLKLSQFVRDTGRRHTETKNPNYRLLHESDKLMGPETSGATVGCTVYQKTMLSNRTKNYPEDSAKFEKIITEKSPLILTEETSWTITRASPNELGVLLWLQAEKKTLQIDCEKKTLEGKEQAMLPIDVLIALVANDVKFVKDGKELKPPEPKTEIQSDSPPPSTPTSESETP